jgi:hypothetical protein
MKDERTPQLWDAIHNLAKVQEYRLKGLTPTALARAQGITNLADEQEQNHLSNARFSYQPDPYSGAPANYETQALGLLQSGFDWKFPPLFVRLESIQKQILFGLDEKVRSSCFSVDLVSTW